MATDNIVSEASREYFDQFLRNNSIKEHSDEEPKLCPLCNDPVRFYFINFNEKLLMCGNPNCDYPFGYEELQIVRVNAYGEEYRVNLSGGSRASSTIWTNNFVPPPASDDDAFSETTILYREINDIQPKSQVSQDTKESTLDSDLKDIEHLNREYRSIKADDEDPREQRQLRSEKWIKKLLHLQEMSGTKLLKPEEINLSKRIEPKLELGELKIDIDPGNGMSKINVQIRNPNGWWDVDKEEADEELQPPVPDDEPITLIIIQDEHPDKFLQPLDINNVQNIEGIVIQEDQMENFSQDNVGDLNISQNMEDMIIEDGQSDNAQQTNTNNIENVEENNGRPKQPDIHDIQVDNTD